ncbi:hypothetical protein [Mycolicibacterium rutilum]|nr:hypothetical protein [Mycolicibacterium rutilum]
MRSTKPDNRSPCTVSSAGRITAGSPSAIAARFVAPTDTPNGSENAW